MIDPVFRILMVCTGNVCRSPQAERILSAKVRPVTASGRSVTVASAGTQALVGQPMTNEARALASMYGAADHGHHARQLDKDMVQSANVIFAMAKEHRRSVAILSPSASKHTFTLIEFARIVSGCARQASTGDLLLPSRGDWFQWLELAETRRGYFPQPSGKPDDVVDPYGRSTRTYEASAAQINEAIESITQTIYG